jgi:DNA topoisomerase-1
MSGKTRTAASKRGKLSGPVVDPVESARVSGLRYVSDSQPGIRRKKIGSGFSYVGLDGKVLRETKTLLRIRSLVIPPAWSDVWISPCENGHIQVTGRDAKGRKQSRYHPHWREVRDETKYQRMILFADALPAIRASVLRDVALPGLPREKVLATIVSLMEATLIRVGNEKYAHDNHSYGLTTMRNRHVDVSGATITFSFQGKSRVHHTINLHDRRLAGIVKRCSDIPGYQLFQYLDAEGNRHAIDSADVNGYLHAISGEHFTAKDFRTWAGSVLACELLSKLDPCDTTAQIKKNVVNTIAAVATRLGNTPTVCRKCYIHPAVLAAYLEGGGSGNGGRRITPSRCASVLHEEERELLRLLRKGFHVIQGKHSHR